MPGLPGFRFPYRPITLNTLCLRALHGCAPLFLWVHHHAYAIDRSLRTRADTLRLRTHRVD